MARYKKKVRKRSTSSRGGKVFNPGKAGSRGKTPKIGGMRK